MNLIQSVYELAESFMKKATEVKVDYDGIYQLSQAMLKDGPTTFPAPSSQDQFKDVLLELVASSVNYCYWYGRHDIRPNHASSSFLYECLANSFFDYEGKNHDKFNECLTRLTGLLIINRFPLIEERMYHLNQLRLVGEYFADKTMQFSTAPDLNPALLEMIELFPGFGSDLFLKRAFLFFMQMNRRFGWFKRALKTMPVAADYQVPKVLEHLFCIKYSDNLKEKIQNNVLIPKGSKEECEIRSATIISCRELCKATGWNIAQVDGYLWLRRKQVSSAFHLTITTDY